MLDASGEPFLPVLSSCQTSAAVVVRAWEELASSALASYGPGTQLDSAAPLSAARLVMAAVSVDFEVDMGGSSI